MSEDGEIYIWRFRFSTGEGYDIASPTRTITTSLLMIGDKWMTELREADKTPSGGMKPMGLIVALERIERFNLKD